MIKAILLQKKMRLQNQNIFNNHTELIFKTLQNVHTVKAQITQGISNLKECLFVGIKIIYNSKSFRHKFFTLIIYL